MSRVRLAVLLVGILLLLGLGGLLLFDREQPGPTARGVAVPPEAPPAAPESGASVAESVEPEAEP
ncbi:MAG TPA: hypothetical protein VLL72_12210, partial [Kiloniellales bacterium]|nr:hypothetical protein [Kiloniellales bacterium]